MHGPSQTPHYTTLLSDFYAICYAIVAYRVDTKLINVASPKRSHGYLCLCDKEMHIKSNLWVLLITGMTIHLIQD